MFARHSGLSGRCIRAACSGENSLVYRYASHPAFRNQAWNGTRLMANFSKFDNYVERFHNRMKKHGKNLDGWVDTAEKSTPILFQEAILEKLQFVRTRNNKRCLGIAAVFGGLIALDFVWTGGIGLLILAMARWKHNSGPFYRMLCFDFYQNAHDPENPQVLVFDYTSTRIINVKEIKAITDPNAAYADLMKKIKSFDDAKCIQNSVEMSNEEYQQASVSQRLLKDNLKTAQAGLIPKADSFMLDMKMHGDLCLMKFMETIINQPRNDRKNPYDIQLDFFPNETIWVFFFLHEPSNSPLMCAIAVETIRYIDPDKLMQILTGGKWTKEMMFEAKPGVLEESPKAVGGIFGDGPTIEGTNTA